MSNQALAGALTNLATTAPVVSGKVGRGNQCISALVYDSKTKKLTMVIDNVDLNFDRGTRLDKATNLQVPNSSIKLLQVGRGNFGQNVFGAVIDGTKVRCNMAFRMNLANEQHQKDSDQVIS